MNYGKAVEEVWAWREAFEKELDKIPENQQANYINKTAQDACKKLGIKCRRPIPKIREHV